jgi:hypothetical protein
MQILEDQHIKDSCYQEDSPTEEVPYQVFQEASCYYHPLEAFQFEPKLLRAEVP